MNKKRKFLLIGIVSIGAWFYFYPHLTVYEMQKAAKKKDISELSEHIDFPAVRESVRLAVRSYIRTETAKQLQGGNPFALFGSSMADSYIEPMVETLVSPEGITAIIQEVNPSAQVTQTKQQDSQTEVNMGYESFNSFTVNVKAKSDRIPDITLIFSRNGFEWKLSGIRLSSIKT